MILIKRILTAAVAVFLLITLMNSCTVVDTGTRGIKKRFGKLVDEPLTEGLYFYNPFTTSIVKFDIKEKNIRGKGACNTKDTQVVNVFYTANFAPDPAKAFDLYRKFGRDWIEQSSAASIVEAQIKIAIGHHDAGELVKNQAIAVKDSADLVRESLAQKGINLMSLSFTNIDFSDQFEHAVEEKVVAEQSAQKAKNQTVQIEEEAKQKVMSAKADAEAMRIKSQALSSNPGLTQYEAVQKWNGELPTNIYGSAPIPFLNIK